MKKHILIDVALVIFAFAAIFYGVYALTTSKLNTTGTVSFVAKDCKLTVYGTVTGAISSTHNAGPEASETFTFGSSSSQISIQDSTTITFENDLKSESGDAVPVIYFNDLGANTPAIVLTFHFTNTSVYDISASVTTLTAGSNINAEHSLLSTIAKGATVDFTVTLTVKDASTPDETEVDDNFNLVISFERAN